jgi:alanine racemase
MTSDFLDLAAGGRLTIDLGALVANWRLLAGRLAPGAACAAVVKADAYGLGALEVGPALEAAGCREFFVAHLSEAYLLLPALSSQARIYVLNGLQPGAERACADAGVTPVLNSLAQAWRWRDLAVALGHPLPAALQVDTGMSRLGLPPADLAPLLADPSFFDHAPLALVMSHLACSDEPDRDSNDAQLAAFEALAARLPPARRSLANSGGIFLGARFDGDLARPGVCLYGAAPNPDRPNPMAPVVRLDARVIQVRDVPAGQGVGYGLAYTRKTPGQIATIAVGYADGWPRSLSNIGAAFYQGVRLPIAGRVSMDSITLDVSVLAEHGLGLQLGDEVELLGPHQTLEDVAVQAGTIPYEILTSLGRRYSRTYLRAAGVEQPVTPPLEVIRA